MEFGKRQAVPKEGRPVAAWPDKDEAFTDVTARIAALAQGLLEWRKNTRNARQAAAVRYKAEVKEALSDGDIAPLELKTLNDLRVELGLTPEEAETIQREYPPSERTKLDLKQRQRKLGLKAEDAERLEAEWLASAEVSHRAQVAAGESATQRARAEAERKARAEADDRDREADMPRRWPYR